ncbi:hypothetical protein BOTNAR_0279g00060 [Botryotinia narcissicola]|uniref:Uncharacterized protein n=1 Tax=Botryotinia narcissicola TaxID=278944 RepID=A0A4Z1I3N1_9HELO|nr:hypothetical protein BOTNAR_0279g00060 [Botryotinia narcissicola]
MNSGNAGIPNVKYIHSNDVDNIQTEHYIKLKLWRCASKFTQELESGWFCGQYWQFLISVGTQWSLG